MTNLSPMTALSPDTARAALLAAVTDRLERLEAIAPEGSAPDIEVQMTVVKLMAETVLDLAAVTPDVVATSVGEYLKNALQMAVAADSRSDIGTSVRHFSAWANGVLLVDDCVRSIGEQPRTDH